MARELTVNNEMDCRVPGNAHERLFQSRLSLAETNPTVGKIKNRRRRHRIP